MERRHEDYLSPEDQLLIAAKVNRLFQAKPGNFDPAIQLDEVKSIVQTLDPKIADSKLIGLAYDHRSSSESRIAIGETNMGTVSTGFSSENVEHKVFGFSEYRIGAYVVSKLTGGNTTTMRFKHFWDRGASNISEADPPFTSVDYNRQSLEIIKIARVHARVHPLPFGYEVATFHSQTIWERDKIFRKIIRDFFNRQK
jgi:hypothetical protein